MATWQMKLDLVPRLKVIGISGVLPVALPAQVLDETDWFEDIPPGFEAGIAAILDGPYHHGGDLQYWGDAAGDEAAFAYDNGRLSWIWFAVDASRVSPKFVDDLCAFARRLECVFVEQRTRQVIEPEASILLAALRRSTAAKFVKDPSGTLQNLPPSVGLGEVPNPAKHRLRCFLERIWTLLK